MRAFVVDEPQERGDKYDVRGMGLPDLEDLRLAGGRLETAEFRLDNTYLDPPSAHLA